MAQSKKTGAAASTTTESLLDQVLSKGYRAKKDTERSEAKNDIEALIRVIADRKGEFSSKKGDRALQEAIDELDKTISKQLAAIMHADELRELEGSWRGLHGLVQKSNTSTQLKIRVLNCSKQELADDLEDAIEFDQSGLWNKIYEAEYGTFGGAPFGALVGDYAWGRGADDVETLKGISSVAAAAHAPFISSAASDLFDIDSFTDIGKPRDLAKIFERPEYAAWNSFRDSEDSRYVGLTLPRTLARLPYGADSKKVKSFNFNEGVDGTDHDQYVWSNAAYAFAGRLTEAFDKHGWCVAVRGVEGGGLVEELPAHTFKSEDGETSLKCPTEVAITDRREAELSKLGFMPLVHSKGTDYAVFFGAHSAHRPKKYDKPEANANEQLSSQLPYTMATGRFAHYMKSIARDWVGGFTDKTELQSRLGTWISNYINMDDSAGQELKAKYPLRDARIDVREVAGKPGCYAATAYLKPHFQLEELDVSLRLVAELPQPADK